MRTPRYLFPIIKNLIEKKMVFIGGPRQVGKTQLSLEFLGKNADERHPGYLNWDHPEIPPKIKKGELPAHQPLIILDEIHKYSKWRNLVKGIYDTNKSYLKILVTGSARLDHYRKGGDSLQGRYFYLRLHPFSLLEYKPKSPTKADVSRLLNFGGFPEPLLTADPDSLRLWQRQRISKVIREDLRDLEYVREISLIENLVELLPSRVGSPLSIQSLKEDLEVDHKTIVRWLTILEALYMIFRIPPFGSPKIRAVKKEQKVYFWDWTMVEDLGPRFENMVACQLLKYCHLLEDTKGYRMELRHLRDTDKREVDFVVMQERKPIFAVECKTGEKQVSAHLHYFSQRTSIPIFYQVHLGERSFNSGKVRVRNWIEFCQELQMP